MSIAAIFWDLIAEFGAAAFIFSFCAMFVGGFSKGVTGFSLPLIAISGIGSVMAADIAILALLVPSLVTNVWQSLRSGAASAVDRLKEYKILFMIMPVCLAIAAQAFTRMSDDLLFLIIGTCIILFAGYELLGAQNEIKTPTPKLEAVSGALSGISGGLSGVWGPPVMVYLLARGIKKTEFVQTMGLVFLIGSVVLNLSHLRSGLLSSYSAPYSVAMLGPALLGMWLGYKVQDRLDQDKFKRVILVVLIISGFNLLRRGLF